jgi:hypothetical protein
MQVPFATTSYQSRSLPWSAQRLVNWYAETASTKTKSPVVLLPRPAVVNGIEVGSGPIRGLINAAGILYVVSGEFLYSLSASNIVTNLGTISGAGYVTMADSATQLTIVAEPNGYVLDLNTQVLLPISDPDYPGSSSVTELDSFFIHSVPGLSGQFFVSNPGDGLNFDALDFATAETDSDPLLRTFNDHQELWLFGARTIEIWTSNGNATGFPFSRTPTAYIERGCIAKFSVVKMDNSVFWVGDDYNVYRAAGYVPQVISTPAIALKINDASDPSDIVAFSYSQEGHTFYVMSSVSGGWTFCYDASTQQWHERQTFGMDLWQVSTYAKAYERLYVGDYQTNKVYQLELGEYADDSGLIRYEATSPPIQNDLGRIGISRFQLDFEAGTGTTSGDGSNPQAMLQVSKDGGKTWGYEQWRPMGQIGEYLRRTIWRRQGVARQWVFKVAATGPAKCALMGAYADVESFYQ